jgi:type I restriction enzyme M protein
LISQNGWFTAHKYVIDTGFVRLNKHRIYKPKLMRIDITNKIREEILSNLNIMGINEFSLFPGLDGLSNYLEWTFKNKQ